MAQTSKVFGNQIRNHVRNRVEHLNSLVAGGSRGNRPALASGPEWRNEQLPLCHRKLVRAPAPNGITRRRPGAPRRPST